MLITYKKSHEKIAMGLLSYMPDERSLKTLQRTLEKYEKEPDWQLFLWRQEGDFIGLIGIEVDELTFTVHHVSVNPSYQSEGIGHAMVEKIQELQEPRAMQASNETKDFLTKIWETNYPL